MTARKSTQNTSNNPTKKECIQTIHVNRTLLEKSLLESALIVLLYTRVSDLWTGSTSDKQKTKLPKLINKCGVGDSKSGDNVFIKADLNEIHLMILPLKKHGRLTKCEKKPPERFRIERIHVER